MLHRHFAAVAVVAAIVSGSVPVLAAPSAKEKAEAKALVADAKKALKDKRWMDAVNALRKASKLDPSPAIGIDLAQGLAGAGKLVEAGKVLAPIAEGKDRAAAPAKKALAALQPRIPTVKVAISGPPDGKASTLVDGVEVENAGEISLNPGDHTIGASAEGFEPAEKEVHFAEGAHEEVALTLASKAPPEAAASASSSDGSAPAEERKHGSRVPGAALTVLGGAGVLTGAIFGVVALRAGSSARAQCNGNLCPSSAADAIGRAKDFGSAANVALIAGGAIATAGIVLTIVAPGAPVSDDTKSARVSPWIGPGTGGLSVRGTF